MGKVRRNAGKEYDLIGMHLCVGGSVEWQQCGEYLSRKQRP